MANSCRSHLVGQTQANQKQHQVVVMMVPFPAQGHLNQLLQLSRLIASYNIPVHFAGTITHSRQARLRVHGWDPDSNNIHFHEFENPSFSNPPPNPNSTIKFPSHLQPSFDASSTHLRQPVASLLHQLSCTARRVVLIHDSMMASAVVDIVSIPNAEACTFHSVSAFTIFLFLWEKMGKPFPLQLLLDGDDNILKRDIPSLDDGCFSPEFLDFMRSQYEYCNTANLKISGRIYNTCRVLESTYLDLLEKPEISKNLKNWALGPFNPVAIDHQHHHHCDEKPRHRCLEWLDKQAPRSVILVSFGTTITLSDKQIKELAIGLEQSGQRFIWVLREADIGNVFSAAADDDEKPTEYVARVWGGNKGMIIKDWAPQLEILAHVATGGFMSHCGWNSCMESISMGVPLVAWPMHSDQPRNAVLITRMLGVGIEVRDWSLRDELVAASTIAMTVERLMASAEGAEMRRRAGEMGVAVRRSLEEGGGSRKELASFIAHITR